MTLIIFPDYGRCLPYVEIDYGLFPLTSHYSNTDDLITVQSLASVPDNNAAATTCVEQPPTATTDAAPPQADFDAGYVTDISDSKQVPHLKHPQCTECGKPVLEDWKPREEPELGGEVAQWTARSRHERCTRE